MQATLITDTAESLWQFQVEGAGMGGLVGEEERSQGPGQRKTKRWGSTYLQPSFLPSSLLTASLPPAGASSPKFSSLLGWADFGVWAPGVAGGNLGSWAGSQDGRGEGQRRNSHSTPPPKAVATCGRHRKRGSCEPGMNAGQEQGYATTHPSGCTLPLGAKPEHLGIPPSTGMTSFIKTSPFHQPH